MNQASPTMPGALFDALDVEYDPLADLDLDEDGFDDAAGQQGPLADPQTALASARRRDDRPAVERIDELFEALSSRRRVLLGILAYLDEPRRSDALIEQVEELQEHDRAVYTGLDYAELLAEAGAVRRAAEDGSAFDEEAEQPPDVVEVDGARFYKPVDGKQVFWVVTDEGRAYLASDDPFGRLGALAAEEPVYRPVYRRVLAACTEEGGRTVAALEALVNDDPLVQKPRRFCSYFVKRLEDCGALSWQGRWRTTELGARALEALFAEGPTKEGERS